MDLTLDDDSRVYDVKSVADLFQLNNDSFNNSTGAETDVGVIADNIDDTIDHEVYDNIIIDDLKKCKFPKQISYFYH